MSFDPNDPRLTAFALGELDASERAEVESLIGEDADVLRQIEEVRAMARLLTEQFQAEPSIPVKSALSAVIAHEIDPAKRPRRSRTPWILGLAAGLAGMGVMAGWVWRVSHEERRVELALYDDLARSAPAGRKSVLSSKLGEGRDAYGEIPDASAPPASTGDMAASTYTNGVKQQVGKGKAVARGFQEVDQAAASAPEATRIGTRATKEFSDLTEERRRQNGDASSEKLAKSNKAKAPATPSLSSSEGRSAAANQPRGDLALGLQGGSGPAAGARGRGAVGGVAGRGGRDAAGSNSPPPPGSRPAAPSLGYARVEPGARRLERELAGVSRAKKRSELDAKSPAMPEVPPQSGTQQAGKPGDSSAKNQQNGQPAGASAEANKDVAFLGRGVGGQKNEADGLRHEKEDRVAILDPIPGDKAKAPASAPVDQQAGKPGDPSAKAPASAPTVPAPVPQESKGKVELHEAEVVAPPPCQ